jgi:hypothetical protein
MGAYTLLAEPAATPGTGTVDITITVSAGNRPIVRGLVRRFNIFSSDTVLDIAEP